MSNALKPESLAEIESRFGKGTAQSQTRDLVLTHQARGLAMIERACAAPSYGPTYSTNSADYPACCAQAVRGECVCVTAWQCVDHGSVCRGSHD